jgi:CBS domain-containing protein
MEILRLCEREVVCIDRNASLEEAGRRMRHEHVGALVVTRRDGVAPRHAGIVTDRDLAIEVIAQGLDPGSLCIGALVREPIVEVPASASLRECAEAMHRDGVRRVLVVDDEGVAVGLVSADDVLAEISRELGYVSSALRGSLQREAVERPALPGWGAADVPGRPDGPAAG